MVFTGHGNAKMADLNVANVDIHILLKVFGILLEYLRKTKGNFWNILFWVFLFRGILKKFFHLYLAEISFRFNHRHEDIYPTILKMLKHTPFNKNLVRNL